MTKEEAKERRAAFLAKIGKRKPVLMATQGKGTPVGGNYAAMKAMPPLNLPKGTPTAVELIGWLREEAGYTNNPKPKRHKKNAA